MRWREATRNWPNVYSEDLEVVCEFGNHLIEDCRCTDSEIEAAYEFDDNDPFDQMTLDQMRGA